MSTFFRPAIVPPIPIYPPAGVLPPYDPAGNLRLVGCDTSVNLTTGLCVPDVLWALPCFEKEGSILSKIGIRRTGWGSWVRVGIYSDEDLRRVPNKRLVNCPELHMDAPIVGLNYFTANPLPYTFVYTGIYWYVILFSTNITLQVISDTLFKNEMIGYSDPNLLAGLAQQVVGIQAAFPYADLPDPFPAAMTLLLQTGGLSVPAIFRQYAKIGA